MTPHVRNFYAFQWHAAFHTLTVALTDINTVLPALVLTAGGGSVEVGLLTAIMVGTPIVGQLLFASYLHLKPRKRGFLLLGINLRVAALALAGIVMYWAGSLSDETVISLVFLLMFAFAFAGTFAVVSYTDILGKALLHDQRGRFFVNRQVIISLAFLASAPAARWILGNLGYPDSYALMFVLAAGLLFIASFGFWAIDEPDVKPSSDVHSVREVLRSIPQHLRDNPQLRRYILVVNLTGFGLTLMPFYVAYASTQYGLTGVQVGSYLLVQILGMIVSNIVWARLVKRFGFRGVLRACIICGTALPLLALALTGTSIDLFLIVFFLMGVGISARKISFDGLLIEITTDTNRALFGGMIGATSLTTAFFPLIAGGLIATVGYAPVFLGVSAIVASAFFVTGHRGFDSSSSPT